MLFSQFFFSKNIGAPPFWDDTWELFANVVVESNLGSALGELNRMSLPHLQVEPKEEPYSLRTWNCVDCLRRSWEKNKHVLVGYPECVEKRWCFGAKLPPRNVYKSMGDALLHQNSLDGLDGFWLAKVRTHGGMNTMKWRGRRQPQRCNTAVWWYLYHNTFKTDEKDV